MWRENDGACLSFRIVFSIWSVVTVNKHTRTKILIVSFLRSIPSIDRILKTSSFDAVSGRKLFDIFHCEYQDCFLATANPWGYIMLGYLCSTHFTGGHVISEARLTKLKIHLSMESKSISCLAGSGNWYLDSSSCISYTRTALQLRKELPRSLEEKQTLRITRLIIRPKVMQKLLKCISGWEGSAAFGNPLPGLFGDVLVPMSHSWPCCDGSSCWFNRSIFAPFLGKIFLHQAQELRELKLTVALHSGADLP